MQCARIFKRKKVAGHGPAVIVDHRCEPRLGNLAVRTEQQNVEWSVIGLPDRIRCVCFTPMNQFEGVAVRLRPVMGECDQIGGQRSDDAIDEPVARRILSQILCQPPGLTADRCNRNRRLL